MIETRESRLSSIMNKGFFENTYGIKKKLILGYSVKTG